MYFFVGQESVPMDSAFPRGNFCVQRPRYSRSRQWNSLANFHQLQITSGMAPGLANARPPGKIYQCPTPGTDKAGKCPAVARRGGGGGWAQVELTDALFHYNTLFRRNLFYKLIVVDNYPVIKLVPLDLR